MSGPGRSKPSLAMYWAGACGGCEIALVNLHERLLEVVAAFDFVFCPCLLDTKKSDVAALPDGGLSLTLFNGTLRTEENREMAQLLRRKSAVLVAFGSCAHEGCVPALANLSPLDEIWQAVYLDNPSTPNPQRTVPQPCTRVGSTTLTLPALLDRVYTLADEVAVDYVIPGCPPEPHQIWNVMEALIAGRPLPPRGSVLGAGRTTVCEECPKRREDKKVARLVRAHQIVPDPERCLLEQGLICMGVATRDGCGALCPQVNMPCTGCYGAPEGVLDQGARMVSALGSILDIDGLKGLSEAEIAARVDALLSSVPDLAGTFYKYSLAHSLLKGGRS